MDTNAEPADEVDRAGLTAFRDKTSLQPARQLIVVARPWRAHRMAARGSFQAIAPDDVIRLLSLQDAERWDFAAGEAPAKFVARMDKMSAPIHCALSDGTLDGTLGEPPLCSAVLGDHLVYQSKWGDYVYLKHPAEVTDIAGGLAALSRDEFADKWEAVQPNLDSEALGLSFVRAELEFVWPCVEKMGAFYRRAAAEGLAVLFCWG